MADNKLQPARGTRDILPQEYVLHSHVIDTAYRIAQRYGYQGMATPIFEFTEVFKRTLGDVSDIVSKEMYSFDDRGGENITLRPEFTAGISRAFISNGLTQHLPLKLFSAGPIFRYERPQKGRFRQFHQVNMEFIGIDSPRADAEIIAMGAHILSELGILQHTELQINSLGDAETRMAYRNALVEYLQAYKNELSADSQVRLEKNPMRILDSKDADDRKIIGNAPLIGEHYSSAAKEFFAAVTEGLDQFGVRYKITPHLVRGLDYYCHTAFEFVGQSTELGSQSTVMAGGRYDGLIGMMGGPHTPAVGFAAGVERLAALVSEIPAQPRPVAIIPIGEECERQAVLLASELRHQGIAVVLDCSGNPAKRMKSANKANARIALFLGDDEVKKGVVTWRDLDSRNEKQVSAAQLLDCLGDEAL
jgi:histidyl-tRNA synthetase